METQKIEDSISRACDESMPRRRHHKNQRSAFWWNREISELWNSCKKQRRKAQRARKTKRPGQEEEEDKCRDARMLLRNAIKQSKRQCWKALCTDVDRDPWGTLYRLVIRKLQVSQGAVAPTDVTTVLKIVEALFPEGAPRESYPRNVAPEVPLFQMSELKLAAKRLVPGKALGPDGIPNEVLRVTIREKRLERGHFPIQWKRQKLVLIPKGKNKNAKAPSLWRPLCMLESTRKLYERMILNRVQLELDDPENEGLLKMQYGFCAGRSTSNSVQVVQKSVDKAFSMKPKPGGFCAVVTLDVKNVFNTANWEHIYQALNKRLPLYLMRVISSYLEDRTLMVEMDDGTKEIEITAGVV